MRNVSVFQIVVLALFIFIAMVGIAVFAGFGGTNRVAIPKATIWGTVPGGLITELVRNINIKETLIEVNYVEKDPETFERDFVNALAEGNGPDAVLLTDDMLYSQRNKLQLIPPATLDSRTYLNTYIDAASLFADKEGITGIPFMIDPMVMYWNKNIFSFAGVSRPPYRWSELQVMAPAIIKKTDTARVTQALVALGEYQNLTHAKEVLVTLFMQAGNKISAKNPLTGATYSVIDDRDDGMSVDPETLIQFFGSFANPSDKVYSWNRSMPPSQQAFLNGNLALYFGFASELRRIQEKNPNLNFDVAAMPNDPNGYPAVYGRITAFSIVKRAKNPQGAYAVINKLTSPDVLKILSELTNLPPVRREMLTERPADPYMTIFYKSAIQSQSWYDPDAAESDTIFGDMIESITTGRKKVTNALSETSEKLDRLYSTR
ncbi:MAG: extracellular solute-binding protein [Candidatus Taylorbacteria bacterium]|nr:extracellular solute-binding protein [Candidatus Taylorbacteria bacterium]